MKQKLLILDANALVHRAFHALPSTMATKDGKPTNAIYGFVSVLIKALKDIKPTHIAVCFDVSKKTFRNELYVEYKATRAKQPDELYVQFPYIKNIIKNLNINIFEKEGYEADDIIGTICKKFDKSEDIDTIILTGDKDTLQLVDKNTKVYTFKTGISDVLIYDENVVKEKIGVSVNQIIDYKALRGDPSDNIPGVDGIGEKTAVELLTKFGTLEKIYEYVDTLESAQNPETQIKPRILNFLKEQKENAFLSYKLSTIELNVDIDFDIEKCKVKNFDLENIRNIFLELEIKTLLDRILELEKILTGNNVINLNIDKKILNETSINSQILNKEKPQSLENKNYIFIDSENSLETLFQDLEKQKEFAFDIEKKYINNLEAKIIGFSFSFEKDKAYYFDFNVIKNNQEYIQKLKNIFENQNIKKIGHNIKYLVHILRRLKINLSNIYFDTEIAAYILYPGEKKYTLDNLSFSELGHKMQEKEKVSLNKKLQATMDFEDPRKICYSCCENADCIYKLYKYYLNEFEKNNKLKEVFFNIEMKLIPVLIQMEQYGVKINEVYLKEISVEYENKIKEIEKFIFNITGPFNLNSPKQLQEILFTKLNINTKGIKKIKTGISTASDQLEKLRDELIEQAENQVDSSILKSEESPEVQIIEILNKIIEYREYEKLKTTYIDTLPEIINKETNRIHTNYNQTIAATGRLSSIDPNLQNIPVRTEDGKKIRKAFISEEGYKLIAIDYSQIELRIVSGIANQESMIEAFKNNIDIHKATAAAINNIELHNVTKEQRYAAKAVNFGILYGMGPRKLSKETGISFKEAKSYIEKYFLINKSIEQYVNNTINFAKENEYVEDAFGRRRYVKDINSPAQMIASAAERIAVNMPIQGTAADIIKLAMIEIYDKINSMYGNNNDKVKLLLQVHDELVFEIKEEEINKIIPIIKTCMEECFTLPNNVKIKVDIEIGNNWGDLEDYKI